VLPAVKLKHNESFLASAGELRANRRGMAVAALSIIRGQLSEKWIIGRGTAANRGLSANRTRRPVRPRVEHPDMNEKDRSTERSFRLSLSPACLRPASLSGGARHQCALAAIGHKAEADKAQQHHCPGGRLGDGLNRKGTFVLRAADLEAKWVIVVAEE
jgi:hypothetical protein